MILFIQKNINMNNLNVFKTKQWQPLTHSKTKAQKTKLVESQVGRNVVVACNKECDIVHLKERKHHLNI